MTALLWLLLLAPQPVTLHIAAAAPPVVLSFTLPTYSATSRTDCTPDTLNPKRDLDSLEVFGTRQSVLWGPFTQTWAQCHSRADSNAVMEMWWAAVKQDADPQLLRRKGERGREGAHDTCAVARGEWLQYLVRCSDRTGNRSCWSGVQP